MKLQGFFQIIQSFLPGKPLAHYVRIRAPGHNPARLLPHSNNERIFQKFPSEFR